MSWIHFYGRPDHSRGCSHSPEVHWTGGDVAPPRGIQRLQAFSPFGAFIGAYNHYRATNNLFEMSVMMPALIGLFMLALVFNLLIGNGWNFNWNLLWPIMLIILGLGMIFGRSRTE